MISFWQAVHKDAKYIKKESFRLPEFDSYQTTAHQPQRTTGDFEGNYNSVGYGSSSLPNQGGSQTWHATGSKQQLRTFSQRTPAQRSSNQAMMPSAEQQFNSFMRRRQLLLILIVCFNVGIVCRSPTHSFPLSLSMTRPFRLTKSKD